MIASAQHSDADHVAYARTNLQTYWQEYEDMTVIAVYDRNPFKHNPDREGVEIYAAVAEHYDHHAFFKNYWSSVPLDSIADSFPHPSIAYLHIFCDPRLFSPLKAADETQFLWPWQRCLSSAGGNVNYRAIPTTSLVFDLRNSTTAMNLFNREERYAEFIDEISLSAREIVVKHGGFFDKETGDGIVAHFCHLLPAKLNIKEPSSVSRAFDACEHLGLELGRVCQKYQIDLQHGIGGLGPSIGIDFGDAVWMVVDQQVRAIGSSVVTAARLCATAEPFQAVLSNRAFVELSKSKNSSQLAQFVRKDVAIKEHGDGARLYAHAHKI